MNVHSYLKRISYQGSLEPSLNTLRKLHRAHMYTVPFENLDIHHRQPIQLDSKKFFRKIVHENRGGFCYELNGLFVELLSTLGYRASMLSARVANSDGTFSQEFDHMTLLVELDEPWIADVGFGDSFIEPIPLKQPDGIIQNGKTFRIIPSENSTFLYQYQTDPKTWMNQYIFQLTPHNLNEFSGMCDYHQTSPESTFMQKVVCSRATDSGRITLTDKKLIVTSGNQRVETDLTSKEEFYTSLKTHFGISF